MSDALYSALSGALMNELQLQTVANNLANANTDGFKETKMSFKSVLENQEGAAVGDPATPFVTLDKKEINHLGGALVHTGNKLDLALQGPGFFQVQTDEGDFFTRNGTLALNQNGELITSAGHKVMGDAGVIRIESSHKDLNIDSKGNIFSGSTSIGKLKMVEFQDLTTLDTTGGTLFKSENAAPQEAVHTQVVQGARESSNVNVTKSLVSLIDINRQYESYQKVIKMKSDMQSAQMGQI